MFEERGPGGRKTLAQPSSSQTKFSANPKLKPIVAMTLKLPRELYVSLKAEAVTRGATSQKLMLDAVREYLRRRQNGQNGT